MENTPPPKATPAQRPAPELVRCACAICGTHTNALRTYRVVGNCANCGSFELDPIEGAEPLGGAPCG